MRRPLQAVQHLRVVGFDDAPFSQRRGQAVRVIGSVCSNTRFEGMVQTWVRKDGWNATDALLRSLRQSKFLPQLHLVLLDGLGFGGFNLVALPKLAAALERPCVAVMRRRPDDAALEHALHQLPGTARRRALLAAAGPVYSQNGFVFQCQGARPEEIAELLPRLTDRGRVPEALRLAHLIGGAIAGGQSGRRA